MKRIGHDLIGFFFTHGLIAGKDLAVLDIIETDDLNAPTDRPQPQGLERVISHVNRPYSMYSRRHIYLLQKANYRICLFRLLL